MHLHSRRSWHVFTVALVDDDQVGAARVVHFHGLLLAVDGVVLEL